MFRIIGGNSHEIVFKASYIDLGGDLCEEKRQFRSQITVNTELSHEFLFEHCVCEFFAMPFRNQHQTNQIFDLSLCKSIEQLGIYLFSLI